ncbi:MAG: hypothetical protein AB1649_33900 [Chloroflexota bacterium]
MMRSGNERLADEPERLAVCIVAGLRAGRMQLGGAIMPLTATVRDNSTFSRNTELAPGRPTASCRLTGGASVASLPSALRARMREQAA